MCPGALVGSPGPLRAPLGPCGPPLGPCGPPGHLWAGPLWSPLGTCGPGPCGPPGALRGQALMGTLVNHRSRSMARPLNLLATLKWHQPIYT